MRLLAMVEDPANVTHLTPARAGETDFLPQF
jgi:hypothetical protein